MRRLVSRASRLRVLFAFVAILAIKYVVHAQGCGQFRPSNVRLGHPGHVTKPTDALDDATPHCARCLIRLDIETEGRRAWWRCPSCGMVRL